MWKLNDTTCVTLPKLLFRITHTNNNKTTKLRTCKISVYIQEKGRKLVDHIFPLSEPHFASVALISRYVRASRSDFRKSAPAGIRAYYFTYWPSWGWKSGYRRLEISSVEKALGIFRPGRKAFRGPKNITPESYWTMVSCEKGGWVDILMSDDIGNSVRVNVFVKYKMENGFFGYVRKRISYIRWQCVRFFFVYFWYFIGIIDIFSRNLIIILFKYHKWIIY